MRKRKPPCVCVCASYSNEANEQVEYEVKPMHMAFDLQSLPFGSSCNSNAPNGSFNRSNLLHQRQKDHKHFFPLFFVYSVCVCLILDVYILGIVINIKLNEKKKIKITKFQTQNFMQTIDKI